MYKGRGTIYKLIDTRDNSIFYIGKTEGLPKTRLSGHISGGKSQSVKSKRIREIKACGFLPAMEVIEETEIDTEDWPAYCQWRTNLSTREKYWIKWHREAGHILLNTAPDDAEGLALLSPEKLNQKLAALNRREQVLQAELRRIQQMKKYIFIGLSKDTQAS